MEFVLLQFLIWRMMLCAIRGNARRKTNNYHFNTEDRRIIWLENTQWHMLSSISVANTEADTTRGCGKESSSNGNNTFKLQLFHSAMSRHSLISPNSCALHMKSLHAPSSQYPHTDGPVYRHHHIPKLLLLQDCDCVTEQSSLLTPIYSFKRGSIPRQQTTEFCFPS